MEETLFGIRLPCKYRGLVSSILLNTIPVNEITLSLETLTLQGIQALDPNDNYCPKQPIFQNTAQCDRSIVMQKLRWEPTPTIRKKAQN